MPIVLIHIMVIKIMMMMIDDLDNDDVFDDDNDDNEDTDDEYVIVNVPGIEAGSGSHLDSLTTRLRTRSISTP